jgi:hypothetical protein
MDCTCNICGLTKPDTEFRSRSKCKECRKAYLKEFSKNHYQANKEAYHERNKLWIKNNPDKSKEYGKKWLEKDDNKEKMQAKSKEYHTKNRKILSEKEKIRINNDIHFKIKKRLRNRLYIAVTSKGTIKSKKTLDLLGCSIIDLKSYLEAKFLPTMTWDNYGEYWHIDHTIPCSSFNLLDEEEQKKCFHYTNLQPLFAFTQTIEGVEYIGNINKGDKLLLVNEKGHQYLIK